MTTSSDGLISVGFPEISPVFTTFCNVIATFFVILQNLQKQTEFVDINKK